MTHINPKYPEVSIKLVGEDGNAFAILGRCQRAARKAGIPSEEITNFMNEAKSGSYVDLLLTCQKWFSCDNQLEEYEND